ncbi:MAG: phosphopyruvate hydratase [Patescibacteria group bacterium]
MPKIVQIKAREILDSRGWPTVEAEVWLENEIFGRAGVPAGASTGQAEAKELRDNKISRYGGRGVLTAVKNIETEIAQALVNQNWDQTSLDKKLIELDDTDDKARLGANGILAVSLAFAKASAIEQKISLFKYFGALANNNIFTLPRPMINILNGGAHAKNSTDIQEFLIIPIDTSNFSESLERCTQVYHALGEIISQRGLSSAVGDEGGYVPAVKSNQGALDLIMEAIKTSGLAPGTEMALGLDVAASELFQNGQYYFKLDNEKLNAEQLTKKYRVWRDSYPLISIEDPFAEEAWSDTTKLTKDFGKDFQIVGDDLFTTNLTRLKKGIELGAGNAILIKPNQIGTITETIEVFKFAKNAGYKTIISHRSGETGDTTIAHLAVGLNAGQIKTGAPDRGERTAKYNELLRIEEMLQK